VTSSPIVAAIQSLLTGSPLEAIIAGFADNFVFAHITVTTVDATEGHFSDKLCVAVPLARRLRTTRKNINTPRSTTMLHHSSQPAPQPHSLLLNNPRPRNLSAGSRIESRNVSYQSDFEEEFQCAALLLLCRRLWDCASQYPRLLRVSTSASADTATMIADSDEFTAKAGR
jgi:hypothetical protein